MKNLFTYLKTLVLFGALLGAKTTVAQINQCSVAISYTVGANGNVDLEPITAQTLGISTWAFGNGVVTYTAGNVVTSTNYTANGVYTVTLTTGNAAFTCTSIVTQTIAINNVPAPCGVNTSFNYSSSSNTFNFNSTSTGTSGTSSYSWNYGDGATGSGPSSSHTYTADGFYMVNLVVSDATPATCTSTSNSYISVCTATNDFTIAYNANGNVDFTSTAPTSTTSYFSWNFGDGGQTSGPANTSAAPTHTYATNGTYVVNMMYQSAYGCTITVQHTVTVSNVVSPCSLNVGFSYSQASGNVIIFSNTSTGTSGGVSYVWNFGDGYTSTSVSPTHTYATAGNYNVTLFANNNFSYTCVDSTFMTVSTTTCIANAGFTLVPSGTPQNWVAFPAAPVAIASAEWNWGDGSTSNTLYTSHTYSAAGFYTICLTVTTTCGSSGTSCWIYNIYKGANGTDQSVISVTVLDPATVGIKNTSSDAVAFSVSPNPNNGAFQLNLTGLNASNASLKIYNVVGQEVYATALESVNSTITKDVQLDTISNGVYFVKLSANGQTLTKKIVISKN